MGRSAPLEPDAAVPSILDVAAHRDYLATIHERLAALTTRWVQEKRELNQKEQWDTWGMYNWMLDEMEWLLREIEAGRMPADNGRNEEVYDLLDSTIRGGRGIAKFRSGGALTTFDRLSSELTALLAELRTQE